MSTALRMRLLFAALVLCLLAGVPALAQMETATLSGVIQDPNGRVVPDVEVSATRIETGTAVTTRTNGAGIYFFTGLMPGHYHLMVRKPGFKEIAIKEFQLYVQDKLEQNFSLEIGSVSETVTVSGANPLLNTTDAAVSTVVDQKFVENIPLNGRSFQALLTLTPGVVLTRTSSNEQGQFSVNGQRADANYFTVDGVSANIGISSGLPGQSFGGALPGLSALGGTNSLISVDAMQEFRIQTSSFAPEFGRTPGGQVSIISRSGTNRFHGSVFEYFRNDVLDAKDWFVSNKGLPKPPERQNDFGGTFSGPVFKDRTFFFFSYEGLRLRQPLTATEVVPSTTLRQTAPAQIQPYLNAYPAPNGPDLGTGFAQFSSGFSNPSSLDAYSLRVDHAINSKVALFGRWNYSPSETVTRGSLGVLSNITPTQTDTQTVTLGSAQTVSTRITNDFRVNYSWVRSGSRVTIDSFGGAVPLTDASIFPNGVTSENGLLTFAIIGPGGSLLQGKNVANEQHQLNLLDNLSVTVGSHQLKFGFDYRRLTPFSGPRSYDQTAVFSGMNGVLSTVPIFGQVGARESVTFLVRDFSAYAQDTWKVTPRLTLSYGLRWDISPPLKGDDSASEPLTVQGLSNPATMSLAPRGTPLYTTTYGNVAPRVGMAYQVKQTPGWEAVIRGGFGVFFDVGTGSLGNLSISFPFTATKGLPGVPFPFTSQQAAPPTLSLAPPVTGFFYTTDPSLKLPRTYQWNFAVEQSLGQKQAVSLTYVGALGRDLLRQDTIFAPNATFSSSVAPNVTRNSATSDYHALQVKFDRRLSRGLQTLASYTFSHSIDIASTDSGTLTTPTAVASPNIDRGNSDFDIRHSFSGGIIYDLPAPGKRRVGRAILGDWSVESLIIARSAPPVDIAGTTFFVAGSAFVSRPNVIAGIPLYLFGPQYPGGKIFNNTPNQGGPGCKGPFCLAPAGQQGSLGRNVLRGFGAWQADFALRRQLHITEKLGLQFRAEFFNVFNHPNFGSPTNSFTSPLFGQSTQTLASSLGSGGANGGFNPLYQIGGPRSIQFALKLIF